MAVGDIYIAKMFESGPSGEELLTTYGFIQTVGAPNLDFNDMQAFALLFETNNLGDMLNIQGSNVTAVSVSVECLVGANAGLTAGSNTLANTGGGSAGNVGPLERAIVYRKETNFTGRQNRGRVFVPGPCVEAFNNEGSYNPANPDVAAINAYGVRMTDVISPVAGVTLTPAILHLNTIPVTATVFSTSSINTRVGIQRRRRIGIGA